MRHTKEAIDVSVRKRSINARYRELKCALLNGEVLTKKELEYKCGRYIYSVIKMILKNEIPIVKMWMGGEIRYYCKEIKNANG